MIASGTLIQNTAFQLMWVAIKPPTIGPITAALPNVLEIYPCTLARASPL